MADGDSLFANNGNGIIEIARDIEGGIERIELLDRGVPQNELVRSDEIKGIRATS